MSTISTWWMWLAFIIFIAIMLTIDVLLFNGKKPHKISLREAGSWCAIWVLLALIFNGLLWYYLDISHGHAFASQKAMEFLTGYLIEKSLSIDNIFVFLMIFNYFAVPAEYQRRVLLYGVLGAIIMRMVLIMIGSWAITHFEWLFYLFGIFLAYSGIKILAFSKSDPDLSKNPVLIWLKRHMKITDSYDGERFFTWKNGIRFATPLFLVMVLVELSDLIFAVDSIPAIFAVTHDPFIVFSSNIFAILGLRMLYFLLADIAERFCYLKYGLGLILVFIGIKMLIASWYKLPIFIALIIIISILITSVILSLIVTRKNNILMKHKP